MNALRRIVSRPLYRYVVVGFLAVVAADHFFAGAYWFSVFSIAVLIGWLLVD